MWGIVLTSTDGTSPARPPSRWISRSPIAFLSKPVVYTTLLPSISALNAAVGMALPMMMTPHVFGEYSLAVTLFQYGLIFDCGAGQLADRWLPAAAARGQIKEVDRLSQLLLWVRFYLGTILFVSAVIALTAFAAMDRLPFGYWTGVLSAGSGILYMVALGPGFVYRALSKRRNYAWAIGTLSLGLVFARPLGLLAGGLTGSFLALAVWYFAFTVFYHRLMPAHLAARPSAREAASSILLGLPLFATSFIWAFYLTANRWFASGLMEPGTFGHFAFSANIFSLLTGAIGGLSAFYYPRVVGRIARDGAYSASREIVVDFSKLTLAVGGIVAVGIVLATPLLTLIYPQYLQSVDSVRVLLAAVPATVLVAWLLPVSLSAGRRPWLDGLLIYPAATAILYFAMRILFRHFDDIGAAAASTVSVLPLIAMLLVQLRHTHILRTGALAVLMAVATAVTGALCALAWMMT